MWFSSFTCQRVYMTAGSLSDKSIVVAEWASRQLGVPHHLPYKRCDILCHDGLRQVCSGPRPVRFRSIYASNRIGPRSGSLSSAMLHWIRFWCLARHSCFRSIVVTSAPRGHPYGDQQHTDSCDLPNGTLETPIICMIVTAHLLPLSRDSKPHVH